MGNKSISFWNYLKGKKIEIPIIQRDYAQGRPGKEALRSKFLASLMKALDKFASSGNPQNEEPLKLDFVYGLEENGVNKPLDGQQRLTTLWLLHWYIALKADMFKEENAEREELKNTFCNFTYETRISSRDFCKQMSNPDNFKAYNAGKIGKYLCNQTWFLSKWNTDPTIKAMLTMLKGKDEPKDKKKNDGNSHENIDGLEKLFKHKSTADFKKYWELLVSDHAPIIFYHQTLDKFGLSDDLYIKMNARGKQLTAFENFKADLIGYIRSRAEKDDEKKGRWNDFLAVKNGIPIKIDTDWTMRFWEVQPDVKALDVNYLSFINRFFWNEMVIKKEDKSAAHIFSLTGESYEKLDLYTFSDGKIPLEVFEKLKTVLDRSNGVNSLLPRCKWLKDDFDFLPCFRNDKPGEITILGRVMFAAVSKYLNEGDYDQLSFNRWMRVVYNVMSGEDHNGYLHVRSAEAASALIRMLEKLKSHNVLESLKNTDFEENGAVAERMREEKNKAEKILDENNNLTHYVGKHKIEGKTSLTWEDIIIDAENYGFFKGGIRFLFTNASGEICWEDFDTKYENVKKYFSCDAAMDEAVQKPYSAAHLLKSLISHFSVDNYGSVLYGNYRVFNNKQSTWMYYLLNSAIKAPVHQLLMGVVSVKSIKPKYAEEQYLYLLSNTGLLDYITEHLPKSWIRDGYNGHYAIYPSSTGVFLNADRRDSFFALDDIEVEDGAKVPDTDLYFGTNISFKFEDNYYRWYFNDKIYLLDRDNGNCRIKDMNAENENDKYYLVEAANISHDEIKAALREISAEASLETAEAGS